MSDSGAGCICVNGRFFDPDEATVSVFDAGFLLGDGLFESLRASEGVPYLLDRHIMRLLSGAAEFEFAGMPRRETITEQVYRTLQRSGLTDAYVRVTVTRGSGVVGLGPPAGPPTTVIAALPLPPRVCEDDGIDATLIQKWGKRCATAKSTSWQHAVLARRRVSKRGAHEGVYVSDGGHVLEGVTSNIFVVDEGRLLTPRVSESLPGVTRARLLELAHDAGLTAIETSLELDTLMSADEVFVTNAVQGLRSVRSIDGIAIGGESYDGMFATLVGLYEEDRRATVGIAG